jgi:hypothetical protein
MSEQKDYKYSGVKLTPGIFRELLIELFDGTLFSRQTAITTISETHVLRGGVIERGSDLVAVFKRATQDLQKQNVGLVNKGYGMWELRYEKSEITILKDDVAEEKNTYVADETIGTGDNAIYVYYYDVYFELSKLKGLSTWECKVGRTDRDPINRVLGQAGTCYPELPHIALIIKCNDSSVLEAALHNVLKMRGRWIADAPGTEWFMTTPQEIKDVYLKIVNEV